MKTIGFAIFLLASVAPSLAQRTEGPPPPVLVVTGNAQILTVPDEATVRLGIVRQASAAQPAQDQVNAVAQEILNAIGKVGVSPQQIQTSRLALTPVYAPRGPEARDAPRIVAYSASNVVTVRLENLSLIGPVIDAGLKAGANQLEGVQFGLRDDLPSREHWADRSRSARRSGGTPTRRACHSSIMSPTAPHRCSRPSRSCGRITAPRDTRHPTGFMHRRTAPAMFWPSATDVTA